MSGIPSEKLIGSHPLDECDPTDCYQTMMAERTELITARRQAEDGFIKTIIQLSSALIVLMAGFIAQRSDVLSDESLVLIRCSIASLILAVIFGIGEQVASSVAYQNQQVQLENYYGKRIDHYKAPNANVWVRWFQAISLMFFAGSLILLGFFAFQKKVENKHEQRSSASASASTSAPTSAPASAPAPAPAPSASAAISTSSRVDGKN